ncbi:response regulator transcription factor [Nocardia harenae]|uniref:response regulator transcription factor n=1 Tax=Nocardia harenae TaxID=358707 RepID=UPI0008298149|nr:LuxR C-terminal-related transcriptional regulator [Nocardia harenae]
MSAANTDLDEALEAVTAAPDRATLATALCAAAAGITGACSALLATVDGAAVREFARYDRDEMSAWLRATHAPQAERDTAAGGRTVDTAADGRTVDTAAAGRTVTALEIGGPGIVLLLDRRVAERDTEAVLLLVDLAVAAAERLDSEERLRLQQARLRALSNQIRTLDSAAADPAFPESERAAEFAAAAAGLTERERDILENILQGASNAAIADIHTLSIETVKTHVKHILRKMGAANRAELIARSG